MAIDLLVNSKHSASSPKSIERIVCSGGGAKGVVYPGAYKALEETGIIKHVKHIAGSSAGAINAALMAVGMPTMLARQYLLNTNLKDLIGKKIGHLFLKNTPGISFITRDGEPLESFIRFHILNTVKSFLDTDPEVQLHLGHDDDLKMLFDRLHGDKPIFTFEDLSILNRLFPRHFKKLTVTAVRFPNGQIQIFNSKLTPHVEIALACRASSSIPVLLKPVEIDINGEKHAYIDGGFYDNLPTDYFDMKEDLSFTKNTIPIKTLVFAFGDGLDNGRNTVYKALYGVRWDESITDAILENIVDNAIDIYHHLNTPEKIVASAQRQAQLILKALQQELVKQVEAGVLRVQESNMIASAIKKIFETLVLTLNKDPRFWDDTSDSSIYEHRLKFLTDFIKLKMKPVLYLINATMMEKLKRHVLVRTLGDLAVPYDNLALKEEGFHKLRSEYPLRTVELRVGTIGAQDFSQASKLSRVMDALGYLDTINHVTNHELHDPAVFNSKQFYVDIMDNFEHIYRAILDGAGSDYKNNALTLEIQVLRNKFTLLGKSQAIISRQLYQLVKDKVEQHLDSAAAFALTRAIEFRNHTLSADELFKETYEESFKRSHFFSQSNISGTCLYKTAAVHEALKNKSMFTLYRLKKPTEERTRTDSVFDSLNNILDFKVSYRDEKQRSSIAGN